MRTSLWAHLSGARAAAPFRGSLTRLALLCLLPGTLTAQQFVTDDAAIVDGGACQVEAWHGERESWVLPACQLVRRVEAEVGLGSVRANGARETKGSLQLKLLVREMDRGRTGIAVVAGLASLTPDDLTSVPALAYAYLPVSRGFADDRLFMHLNLGWQMEREAGDDPHGHGDSGADGTHVHHAITWATRADLLLPLFAERFTLLGEIFGEDRMRPAYQLGLRATLIPERLTADLSRGGHTAATEPSPGWIFGVAWTPPTFF